MKTKAIITSLVAVAAIVAVPAFARYGGGCDRCDRHHRDACCPKVEVTSNNNSEVETINASISNSGLNAIEESGSNHSSHHNRHSGGNSGDAEINTGDTYAGASTTNDVGYNEIDVTAPERGTTTVRSNNNSGVRTINVAASNSGLNKISKRNGGDSEINSGDDESETEVGNVVGTNIVTVR